METAICSSITRAAGLGDTFWRANLRDVAVMAMSSDPNQSLNKPSGKGKAVTPVVPPSLASSSSTFQVQIKSEHNVMERLALEFSSLPDREMVPEGTDSTAGQQQQLTAPGSSSQITPTSNTPTNNLITKTIRAAMSDINKPK
ncbi:hypothetical protein TGAM01_v206722 [Trichoderma gamsii]|uniref:Uncharacterized protein n=1 Tax=Trichoderma gamsii TaxID=398673 RepID=A0A2P4ZJB4_9HYPO|nr:hypothetical protein TGAM01_v206722 [Trichoderma gamsii]PON24390.1 hypothetical protein TGAM01_v206722 [Trichoderma gamsii]